MKEKGKRKLAAINNKTDKKKGFFVFLSEAPFLITFNIKRIKAVIPKMPVVAKSSSTKLEERKKLKDQSVGFKL